MVKKYASLLETYRRIFSMVDVFHFNSQNTADVYRRYINVPSISKVIPIAHGGIADNRHFKNFDNNILRLGFIGSEALYKGLPLLKEVVSRLNNQGCLDRVKLHVYGGRVGIDDTLPNVMYKGMFSSEKVGQVFDDMDLLVVPSVCYETFSFVTLEALSYGTPVLVSDHVGAKDIVMKYAPSFVFHDVDSLYNLIKIVIDDRQLLREYNDKLLDGTWDFSIEEHAKTIVEELYV